MESQLLLSGTKNIINKIFNYIILITKMNKKQNILVTGGAGYIGAHIVELLVKAKSNIIIIDNLVTGHKKTSNQHIWNDYKTKDRTCVRDYMHMSG
tara:strand:+ start:13 stop:300 length:288 start_codon:yes stop_codon:yes gene_type:complete